MYDKEKRKTNCSFSDKIGQSSCLLLLSSTEASSWFWKCDMFSKSCIFRFLFESLPIFIKSFFLCFHGPSLWDPSCCLSGMKISSPFLRELTLLFIHNKLCSWPAWKITMQNEFPLIRRKKMARLKPMKFWNKKNMSHQNKILLGRGDIRKIE